MLRADTVATAHLRFHLGLLSTIMTAGVLLSYKFVFCSAVAFK